MLANIDKLDNLVTNYTIFNDFNKIFILLRFVFSQLLIKKEVKIVQNIKSSSNFV